jgi:Xaa-Pro aminopeptidase
MLISLESILAKYGDVAYIIPSCDEYQGEYIAKNAKRLEYITGFTGSNGMAVISSRGKHLFFTDGRYLSQSKKELDLSIFEIHNISELPKFDFRDYPQKLYYNPKLFTSKQLDLFKNLEIIPIEGEDLVDQVWQDRPEKEGDAFWHYPIEYAGKTFLAKYDDLVEVMKAKNADYVLLTKSDSICWLLNIRGNDVPFNPVVHGYLIVGHDMVYFFTDIKKVEKIRTLRDVKFYSEGEIEGFILGHCEKPQVTWQPQEIASHSLAMTDKVDEFILNHCHNTRILFDPKTAPIFFEKLFDKAGIQKIPSTDPTILPKAIKNSIEIIHAQDGHKKDGIALAEFFKWLKKTVHSEILYESDLELKLEEFRSKQEGFLMSSFAAICGYQENGAIIHYHAKAGKDKQIKPEGILLIDSGAQYLGCTTDVTRTICLGKPTEEQKRRYTQVLKGHIALMMIHFPIGTSGEQIDALARQYLWMDGVNYSHSTGHGVGSCLNVHEGPHRIAPVREFSVSLQEGMILSNEPGFYKDGEYGIRIENLVHVVKSEHEGFLRFENLTLVKYCEELIDMDMLTMQECVYIQNYHEKC